MTAVAEAGILVNGEARAPEGAVVSVFDRGFQYGDGVFETLALVDGRVREQAAHLERLARGAELLGIPAPEVGAFEADIAELSRDLGRGDRAVIKLNYTRGAGGRGLAPPPDPVPTRVAMRLGWPGHPVEWAETGVRVITCRTRQVSGAALDGRIKSMNQLNHIVARMEWTDPGIAEGLLRDGEGRVVEGTVTNLFLVRDGELVTPDLAGAGLPGVTRGRVLEAAASLGIPVREDPVWPGDLARAEELFLTNSIIGVWPVRELDGQMVADGAPGPVTRRLQQALEGMYAA
jgi:4-amino-4-deoxychorismate lyase